MTWFVREVQGGDVVSVDMMVRCMVSAGPSDMCEHMRYMCRSITPGANVPLL